MDNQVSRNLNMFNDIENRQFLSIIGGHWHNDLLRNLMNIIGFVHL